MQSKVVKDTKYFHLFIDEKLVQYKVIFSSNLKNKIYASIPDDLQECEYVIKAPFHTKIVNIENFIFDNYWKLENLKSKKFNNSYINLENNIISFLGNKYLLEIHYNQVKNKIYIEGNKFIVFVSKKSTAKKTIYNFFQKEAKKIIPDMVAKKAKLHNFKYNLVEIKKLNKAWGNCKIKSKDLAFSYRLMHFDNEIINYVICHELCHLIHPNHSKLFWNEVGKICPNFKECRNLLKNFLV